MDILNFSVFNETCGVAAMEEPNATLEVSSSRDLSADIKGCENDCSCGSHRETSGVSMPICFLVKEQAKSFIAIQELQKRLFHVENVQDDVVDAIIEFRNYLSDSKSYNSLNPTATTNSLNVTRSPTTIFSKLTPASKLSTDVPSSAESTVEVPQSIIKNRTYSSKNCDPVYNEFGRTPTIANLQEQSQKHFDLAKSKDSALESDKQDSGLDSDCRELHEIHPSLNRNAANSVNPENDELLHLLDEISHRSAILQKQLAVAEEATILVDLKDPSAASKSHIPNNDLRDNSCVEPKYGFLEVSNNGLMQSMDPKSKSFLVDTERRGWYADEKVQVLKQNSRLVGLFESKPLCDNVSRKRTINGIDSTVVSSILKETNIVDLQRQALIYLVDNAVLHTKLREAEQTLSSKRLEAEKIENTLREEARLLMMENRELRISLDEQKIETNTLKSRLAMLERVLQSVSNENQELNWQLGESLNLQNLPRRASHNCASSFRFENPNPVGASKSIRRSSFPSQNEANITCVKSKLLSNNSSYLDVAMEDPNEHLPTEVGSTNVAFRCRNGPIQSSTPMVPFQKLKEFKTGMHSSYISGEMSPAKFHSVKKSLKTSTGMEHENGISKLQRSGRGPDETYTCNIPENCVKKFTEETLPSEGVGKFPFNSILEKLKSNSEHRQLKSVSTRGGETSTGNLDSQRKSFVSKSKSFSSQESENSHPKEAKSSQGNNSDVALQRRKGRNIQQRIQNILDRIVAESEEAS